MRKLAANSPVAPIKSSAIRGYARSNLTVSWKIEGYISAWWMLNIFIDSKSQLVKAFETFLEFAFAATPPATEFQSRQFVRRIMPFAHRGDTPNNLPASVLVEKRNPLGSVPLGGTQ